MTSLCPSEYWGSSPLTRGKRVRGLVDDLGLRLIPAHAGKTNPANVRGRRDSAHPRSRGENSPETSDKDVVTGSSPLTRGKRSHAGHGHDRPRLIPAHAGKTACHVSGRPSQWAHPRSRGENGGRVAGLRGLRGSSPLTRGKLRLHITAAGRWRLIPAHAGKTSIRFLSRAESSAHPRSRGENRASLRRCRAALGSSPLTRGKPGGQLGGAGGRRLIPAHAGKTLRGLGHPHTGPAHPRSRGEN